MNLKSKLCEVFEYKITEEGMTYDEIMKETDLSRSQIYYILNKGGGSVSSDKIWDALVKIDNTIMLSVVFSVE